MESAENQTNGPVANATQLTIQQVGATQVGASATQAATVQLVAQDPNNPAKGIYIIDPSQASALQMFANADQRFTTVPVTAGATSQVEFSATTVPQSTAGAGQTILMNQQVLAQRLPVAVETFDEPLYVNAKQYHRIIKRRQARAKLEAEGKIPKQRKKYMHESRHLHACRRNRSNGGRFVGKPGDPGYIDPNDSMHEDVIKSESQQSHHNQIHQPHQNQVHQMSMDTSQEVGLDIIRKQLMAAQQNVHNGQNIQSSTSITTSQLQHAHNLGLLVSQNPTQQHTMLQIQNNVPVMSSNTHQPTLPTLVNSHQSTLVNNHQPTLVTK